MEDHPEQNPDNPRDDQPQSHEVRHTPVGALVPAHVASGTFSTGAVVLQGQHEFIVDFLLRMQQPQQVAARIVLPSPVIAQFIQALQDNLKKHEDRFGEILLPTPPVPSPDAQRQSAQDLYDQLKLAEEKMSGVYANAVMIGHTGSEFSFDFITTFFPKSAVSSRVFLAAQNAKRLLDSLRHAYQQFQNRPEHATDFPPGAMPPGAVPPGTLPPGTLPPGAVPPGIVPPDDMPDQPDDRPSDGPSNDPFGGYHPENN